nr:ribonuclease H-like domain-containing protein [Tanacetum cinerariifolium]
TDMLVEQEIKEEGDADEHVKEVTDGDAAHRDVSAAHREVPTVTEEPSIPSPTPPSPPPQPPQDLPSTSRVQQTPPQSPQEGEETGEEEQVVTAASIIIPTAKTQVPAATLTATPLDYFKGVSYDDIRPIFEAKFNSDVDFLLKTKEQMEEEENKALQMTNETPAEKSAKRRKLNEENCTWSSKGQELEATGIMWCANHNFYNHTADFVSGKKVPTLKIYSSPDLECCKTSSRIGNTVVSKLKVTRPTQYKPIVTKPNSPTRRHINRSPSLKASNSPLRVTDVKATMVNAAKGKLDFDDVYFIKELKFNLFSVSQMCDKKNNVLFTDTECLVLSLEFKLPDENQVLLRVPKENNMYNVNLKNIVPFRDLTCPFSKATIDESNLWVLVTKPYNTTPYELLHGRTPSSGPTWLFDIDTLTRTMNYQPVTAGNQSNPSAGVQEQFDAEKAGEEIEKQYLLFPVWSSSSINPQNTNRDATFDEKEPEFNEKKPESEVNVSLSNSAQSKKHDDKTKREAKAKSHVESFARFRNLSVEFEDFPDNSINKVNAALTLVPTVG